MNFIVLPGRDADAVGGRVHRAGRCTTGAAARVRAARSSLDDSVTRRNIHQTSRFVMLYWAAVFFVIALISAVLGFGGLASGAAGIAKVLFFVFLVLGALSMLFGRRAPV